MIARPSIGHHAKGGQQHHAECGEDGDRRFISAERALQHGIQADQLTIVGEPLDCRLAYPQPASCHRTAAGHRRGGACTFSFWRCTASTATPYRRSRSRSRDRPADVACSCGRQCASARITSWLLMVPKASLRSEARGGRCHRGSTTSGRPGQDEQLVTGGQYLSWPGSLDFLLGRGRSSTPSVRCRRSGRLRGGLRRSTRRIVRYQQLAHEGAIKVGSQLFRQTFTLRQQVPAEASCRACRSPPLPDRRW